MHRARFLSSARPLGAKYMKPPLSLLTADQLEALRRLDACTLANAIETFHERLRNEGYVDHSVRAIFPRLEPMVGFAATIRILGPSFRPTVAFFQIEPTCGITFFRCPCLACL